MKYGLYIRTGASTPDQLLDTFDSRDLAMKAGDPLTGIQCWGVGLVDERPIMTIEEYRVAIQSRREANPHGARGWHTLGVRVPGATHAQLVPTQECFHPSCPDHGWM